MINVSRLYCGIENSSDRFRYHSDEVIGPVVVYNCTNKCSQNCLHCYSRAGASAGELDTKQAKEFLHQLADIKAAVVLFSGGEPIERTDLLELIEYSRGLGLRCVISSNGNLITTEKAKQLFSAGVSYVGISIDGNRQTHDSFRGIAGSFDKAMNGIKACKDSGLKVGLRFTITNRNCDQVSEIFSLAAENKISRICFYHLISAGRATDNNLKCSNEQVRSALDSILENAVIFAARNVTEVLTVGNHADSGYILGRLKRERPALFEKNYELMRKFGGNKIGTKIFAVDACGNVHPDQFWRNLSMGNVLEQNLREILKNPFDIFNGQTAPERCRKCQWLKICGTNMRDGVLEPGCYLNDDEIDYIATKALRHEENKV
jgi:radical SAM protein with 4Fe4S-binding SPASM domain